MRWTIRKSLLIVILMLFATSGIASGSQQRSLSKHNYLKHVLKWRGIRRWHSLLLWSRLGDRKDETRIQVSSPHSIHFLRSAVGPILSTYYQYDYYYNGGYTTQSIEIKYLEGYHFSMSRYIDESGQAGRVIAQLLEGERLFAVYNVSKHHYTPKSCCPTLNQIAHTEGNFVDIKQHLIAAGCVSEEELQFEPESFWIDDWDSGDEVRLIMQTFHPENRRTVFLHESAYIRLSAPKEWLLWLRAAKHSNGIFGTQLADLLKTKKRRGK